MGQVLHRSATTTEGFELGVATMTTGRLPLPGEIVLIKIICARCVVRVTEVVRNNGVLAGRQIGHRKNHAARLVQDVVRPGISIDAYAHHSGRSAISTSAYNHGKRHRLSCRLWVSIRDHGSCCR